LANSSDEASFVINSLDGEVMVWNPLNTTHMEVVKSKDYVLDACLLGFCERRGGKIKSFNFYTPYERDGRKYDIEGKRKQIINVARALSDANVSDDVRVFVFKDAYGQREGFHTVSSGLIFPPFKVREGVVELTLGEMKNHTI
jgi:hypothetical protein